MTGKTGGLIVDEEENKQLVDNNLNSSSGRPSTLSDDKADAVNLFTQLKITDPTNNRLEQNRDHNHTLCCLSPKKITDGVIVSIVASGLTVVDLMTDALGYLIVVGVTQSSIEPRDLISFTIVSTVGAFCLNLFVGIAVLCMGLLPTLLDDKQKKQTARILRSLVLITDAVNTLLAFGEEHFLKNTKPFNSICLWSKIAGYGLVCLMVIGSTAIGKEKSESLGQSFIDFYNAILDRVKDCAKAKADCGVSIYTACVKNFWSDDINIEQTQKLLIKNEMI